MSNPVCYEYFAYGPTLVPGILQNARAFCIWPNGHFGHFAKINGTVAKIVIENFKTSKICRFWVFHLSII